MYIRTVDASYIDTYIYTCNIDTSYIDTSYDIDTSCTRYQIHHIYTRDVNRLYAYIFQKSSCTAASFKYTRCRYTSVEVLDTVDGKNPANQLTLVVYPIIYRVSAPSQVVFSPDF